MMFSYTINVHCSLCSNSWTGYSHTTAVSASTIASHLGSCSGRPQCSSCKGSGKITTNCGHGSAVAHYTCKHHKICQFTEHEVE